jgi:long-chain acyl-CoA synthetase
VHVSEDRPWFTFWPEGVPRHIDYPVEPLFKFLKDNAEKYPDKVAFSFQSEGLTYRELDESTGKLANGLSKLGIKKGDRVLLMLPNSLEFIIGYYGILKVGGTVVPTNPLYKVTELTHQLSDSRASCVITNKAGCAIVAEIEEQVRPRIIILADSVDEPGVLSLQEILKTHAADEPEIHLNPQEDLAAIVYTGGTIGLPKGVMLTHYNLVTNAIQNAVWMNWSNEEIIMGVLPFYHSWGACTCLNSASYCGARVVILPRFNAEELLKTIETERATVLYSAVSLFTMLVNGPMLEKYDISSLKHVKAGAMPIPSNIKKKWDRITGVPMILGYGLSEASPETHDCPPNRIKVGTVGIPIIDTDAKIMDADTGLVELEPGEVGELAIRGPQVMIGYLNRPEDDKEALRDGWLYTGDLAFMDKEGYFHIVDRKKEIIKYKGYTIAPAEIEAVLYKHPAIKECVVVGKPDEVFGEIPKAFVVLRDGHNITDTELIEFCVQRISPYKIIREVEFTDQIPKTNVGKILRRLLRERKRGNF